MKLKLIIIFLPITLSVSAQIMDPKNPVDLVNTLMGTSSSPDLSNGNTYPAIALPWGMNCWTPQTGKMGDGWQYQYEAHKIRGFKQTHQPSPWMNDYGQFSIMPMTGKGVFKEDERASWFSHKAEVARPYYYSVYLADHDLTTEITPTERAAYFRFTFPSTESAFIAVDAFNKGSYIRIIPAENKIIGYSTRNSGGVPENFKNYFVVVFDQPFTNFSGFKDSVLIPGLAEITSSHSGALLQFVIKQKGQQVQAKVASSFISIEQAERNLQEIGTASFESIKAKAKQTWNNTLGKIEIEGGSIDEQRTFYSCLYRMVFFPMKLYEYDAAGNIVHYSMYTGKPLPGYMYGGTGFWDTFRALYPFLNLMYPSINNEMQQALLNDYKEGGWLPEWSSPGYRNVMIGNNSASVVSDAFIKGTTKTGGEELYKALLHGANNEGPHGTGRTGIKWYDSLGYVPYNVGINENAARTLEYAYDDFTISQMAKALHRPQAEIDYYLQRSMNYKKLFDPQTKLMRGKNKDGSFQTPFNPFKWGDAFTEGNSWHYTWSVFHDVEGLAQLMGGHKKFTQMLDSVFVMPPIFDDSYYGFVIHEIREMQIAGMGQYAHGNQPIQHMIYLYNYTGAPWKTQEHVRETMQKLYKATPDGYCGDEDNGQTSAWYVFSALGFYPVCPGTDQYVLGTPLFKKVILHLENGKDFTLYAPLSSAKNKYLRQVNINNENWDKNWISHSTIMKGGNMKVQMSPVPNFKRGTSSSSFPFSISRPK